MEKETFDLIIELMIDAENVLNLSSGAKKIYVLENIKKYVGNETYERYLPMFSLLIDGVILLAHNKHILDELITLKKCCY
jgi:hypothetical protein